MAGCRRHKRQFSYGASWSFAPQFAQQTGPPSQAHYRVTASPRCLGSVLNIVNYDLLFRIYDRESISVTGECHCPSPMEDSRKYVSCSRRKVPDLDFIKSWQI